MIYNLSRNDKEEALSLTVKVCSVEAKGKCTNGKRYKVVLADCSVNPTTYINSKIASSPFAQLLEEEENSFEISNTVDDKTQSSNCEEEIPLSSNLEVVPVTQNLDVALPSEIGADEDLSENDKKVIQFLKNLDEGDFECSIFHGLENDADISDNTSEGSALSLPRPGGSLPRSAASHLQLESPKTEDSLSCSSINISSSLNSSTLSLHQEKNKVENLQEKQRDFQHKTMQFYEPIASSSPKINFKFNEQFPNTTCSSHRQTSVSPNAASTSSMRITGVANKFKDLISPNFLSSSHSPLPSGSPSLNLVERVSPFLKRVSLSDDDFCDDLDDNLKTDDTKKKSCGQITEVEPGSPFFKCESISGDNLSDDLDDNKLDHMNSDLNLKIDETNQEISCLITEEEPVAVESAQEKKSHTHEWVECVLQDSGEDFSLINQNDITNEQEVSQENSLLEFRTPLVEWYQDENHVFIFVKLPAIKKYDFSSNITSVHFSAVYEGVPYQVDLPKLFGGHKPEKAQGTAKACQFEIKLEKLVKGKRSSWPRLTSSDEKLHWLKLNAEKACENIVDSDDDDVKRLACSLPLWHENPKTISIASSDRSELANSELSL